MVLLVRITCSAQATGAEVAVDAMVGQQLVGLAEPAGCLEEVEAVEEGHLREEQAALAAQAAAAR